MTTTRTTSPHGYTGTVGEYAAARRAVEIETQTVMYLTETMADHIDTAIADLSTLDARLVLQGIVRHCGRMVEGMRV